MGALVRAIRYLGKQGSIVWLAYGALVIATLAQLAVPKLVQNMINALAAGQTANLPPLVRNVAQLAAAQQLGISVNDLTALAADAEGALVSAVLLILVFAITRGAFSFIQSYMAEKTSQGIAFDLRNELFAKIQRLSFSYHDRNQTGQLMIRATDDVEKVRLFLAQGLVLAVGAFLLLIATLIILLTTNWQLTLVVLPILPIALVLFMIFGMVTQPRFGKVQAKLSALNTILQENLAGIRVVKAFAREPQEQARFRSAANSLMSEQIDLSKIFSFLFPLIFLIAQLGQAAILYFGGNQIIGSTLTIGEWQKFSL
ncbi:MAG: ABC transporter ATP-binding protein, partial [Anaerolineae bacterium]|nr:ABC transporter ATP-binding protein [Anaerolineae bacterium]